MSKRFFINNIDTYIGQALLNELVKEDTDDPTIMATYTQHDRLDKQRGVKKILKVFLLFPIINLLHPHLKFVYFFFITEI